MIKVTLYLFRDAVDESFLYKGIISFSLLIFTSCNTLQYNQGEKVKISEVISVVFIFWEIKKSKRDCQGKVILIKPKNMYDRKWRIFW
ncbi:hypothetical protein CN679_19920 [Bacillus pseudomycoides]|nr:hypothetical protein CN679_19920 [Bacillus pseudomycoides]